MDERTDWDTISFVFSSVVRMRVLKSLNETRKTPSLIAKSIDQPLSHVSRALRELETRKLVACLTPSRKKARIYDITSQGRLTLDSLSKLKEGK